MSQPSTDARAVVRAIDSLTTQVRRAVDVLSTPVVEHVVVGGDDATTPATTCSARHASTDPMRWCIRAAHHTGKDHVDETGYHWSDTVAVYPVENGTVTQWVPSPAAAVRTIAHHVSAEAYTAWTDQTPADGPRCVCGDPIELQDPRDPDTWIHSPGSETPCLDAHLPRPPAPAGGPCAQHPGAPVIGGICGGCTQYPADFPAAPAGEEQTLRWARRESLLVLLTRVQHGRTLTEDEARTLRHHIETEMRGADAALERARKAERGVDLLADSHRRADIAETELRVLRAGLRANGADPTQIQNLWAQIRLRNRQWREAKQERDQAQAAIERVRAIKRAPTRSDFNTLANAQDNGWDAALHEVHRALDGTEQPTTEA